MLPHVADAKEQESYTTGFDYKPAIGWQFYNLPEKEKEKNMPVPEMTLSPLSAMEQMNAIQQKLDEAKATAIMNPTTENIAIYKTYQDYFTEKATLFSSQWEKTLLEYPHLDYNLQNSHYNGTAEIKAVKEKEEQAKAANLINQHYGIFFFYRGNEPLDNKLAEVVKSFSLAYGLTIIPISVDGRINAAVYPESKFDQGQAAMMSVKHFPAIFLVEPKKEEYKPLAYGFLSEDDLARRMLNVVTDFKPRI
ncbi:type-F conjugative transfer system pilin assembly protein TraF [Testudinibacter sp. TR-2022]|nr:type-F conjugative transfer system pilin assembly protein TraF [Pasteurellaceae bacterium Phil31]TNH10179.1 type-F conjugative transfer system pilin assembly protein TraF [Testudinibacter sp. TR-2022]TNH13040.1 type-F conjugative transfer system pilin assembly protein TraF [Testudinibacter sp. TR-2022]